MTRKLKAWPNNLGYDFGDWEILIPVSTRHPFRARLIPAWFGAATKYGEGETAMAAMANAKATEDYLDYVSRRRIGA
jgi:hypothetical protein